MRILVIGVGGVGGYLAYKLIKCSFEVSVAATEKTIEKIKKEGLRVIDVDKEEVVYPSVDITGIYDVIFVTTKSYSLNEIMPLIRAHSDSHTRVVPILNGIGHFEMFKELNAKVLKACIYILSNKKAANVIHKKTPLFYLCVEDDEVIRDVFKNCDLKVKFSHDIEKDIWKKYLFISVFATLQSYYQQPTGWVMEHKRDEVEKFIDEVIKIAKHYGIDLKDEKERVIKQALNIPYESKMSMQIDFENSSNTEVENITGFLAKKSEFINGYYQKLKSF